MTPDELNNKIAEILDEETFDEVMTLIDEFLEFQEENPE